MKKNLTVLLSVSALVAALSAGLTFARAQTTNHVAPRIVEKAYPPGAMKRHPMMFRAISALRSAKQDMENSGHDFGGHKKAALEACDKAIAQLELALRSDKE
jgi:hypothetical protein